MAHTANDRKLGLEKTLSCITCTSKYIWARRIQKTAILKRTHTCMHLLHCMSVVLPPIPSVLDATLDLSVSIYVHTILVVTIKGPLLLWQWICMRALLSAVNYFVWYVQVYIFNISYSIRSSTRYEVGIYLQKIKMSLLLHHGETCFYVHPSHSRRQFGAPICMVLVGGMMRSSLTADPRYVRSISFSLVFSCCSLFARKER